MILPLETVAVGGNFSTDRLTYGDRLLQGATLYVDASYSLHYGIEAEGRWLWLHQRDSVRDSVYLVGPRVQLNGWMGQRKALRPYAKVLIGVSQFHYPYHYATGEYFVIAPGGGVDYRLTSRIRLRLLDVEYQCWPQFTYGPLYSLGVSSGLRLRLF